MCHPSVIADGGGLSRCRSPGNRERTRGCQAWWSRKQQRRKCRRGRPETEAAISGQTAVRLRRDAAAASTSTDPAAVGRLNLCGGGGGGGVRGKWICPYLRPVCVVVWGLGFCLGVQDGYAQIFPLCVWWGWRWRSGRPTSLSRNLPLVFFLPMYLTQNPIVSMQVRRLAPTSAPPSTPRPRPLSTHRLLPSPPSGSLQRALGRKSRSRSSLRRSRRRWLRRLRRLRRLRLRKQTTTTIRTCSSSSRLLVALLLVLALISQALWTERVGSAERFFC